MKTIKIKIALDGSTVVEANGFTDSSCKSATAAIEKALGGKAEITNKPEAYNNAVQQQTQSLYEY